MTKKEQLYYLINGVLDGSYQVKTFCSEFTRVYDLEVDYEQLSELENKESEICVKWQVDFLMMKKSQKFQICFSLRKVF